MSHFFQAAALQAALNRPLHDAVSGLPVEVQQYRCPLHIGRGIQHSNGKGLEQQREAGMLVGPGNGDGLHAAQRALAAGNPRADDRLELHRIQVPPLPFRSQIGLRTRRPTLRTAKTAANVR